MDESKVHVFEKAGLGKAPFKVIGVETRRGPLPILDKNGLPTGGTIGSPGQPMGCCKFCYTGIAECWIIRSSDGNVFAVGCECVYKTGDAGMKKQMKPHLLKLRHEKDDRRIADARALFDREDVRAVLEKQPHPRAQWSAFFAAHTMADYVEWTFENAGRAGKVRAARVVEQAAEDASVDLCKPDKEEAR